MAFPDGAIVGLVAVLAALAVALGVFACVELYQVRRRALLAKSRLSGLAYQGSIADLFMVELATNGVPLLRLPARAIMRIPALHRLVVNLARVLGYRITAANARALSEALLAGGIVAGVLAGVLSGQLVLGAAGLCAVPFVAGQWAAKQQRQRRTALREQLPDALRGLGMCFMAGLSLEQAFDQTAQECREPLNGELRKTVNQLRTGSTVAEALEALRERLTLEEMHFVSVALEIQHRTGGSMRQVLDAAAESMLSSFDLARTLEVQTAQARLSAKVVSLLPVGLVLVLSLVMEGYIASFFSSTTGLTVLVVALALEFAGIMAIRRILDIDMEG